MDERFKTEEDVANHLLTLAEGIRVGGTSKNKVPLKECSTVPSFRWEVLDEMKGYDYKSKKRPQYLYVNERLKSSHYLDEETEISYFSAYLTSNCQASYTNEKITDFGAISNLFDVALGFHVSHMSKLLALTRYLQIHFDIQNIPLNQYVIIRSWITKLDGDKKIFAECEMVDALTGTVLYGRAKGLFIRITHLPFSTAIIPVYEDALKEWRKNNLINRPTPSTIITFPSTVLVLSSDQIEVYPSNINNKINGFPNYDFHTSSTTLMRFFQKQNTKEIEGAVYHSIYALGPESVHGGAIFSSYNYFFQCAMNILFPEEKKINLEYLFVSYEKQTPLDSISYFKKFTFNKVGIYYIVEATLMDGHNTSIYSKGKGRISFSSSSSL